jgi:hypothetical protein
MTADFQAAGWAVNRKRIARLMRSEGLRARNGATPPWGMATLRQARQARRPRALPA